MSWLSAWGQFPNYSESQAKNGLPEFKRQKSVFGGAEAGGIFRSGYRKAENKHNRGWEDPKTTSEFLSLWPKKAELWAVYVE